MFAVKPESALAMLLTLSGWTSPEVAEAFGVTADSVRYWRQWFADDGVEALRSTGARSVTRTRRKRPGGGQRGAS
jgi:hypothetical protein